MDCLGATSAGAAGATTVGSAASTVAAGDFDPFFDWHAPLEERDCKFPMQVHDALPTPPPDVQAEDFQDGVDGSYLAPRWLTCGDSFQDRLVAIDQFVWSVAEAFQPRDGQGRRELSTARLGTQPGSAKGNGRNNATSLLQDPHAKRKLPRGSTPATSSGRGFSKQESAGQVLGQSLPDDDWGEIGSSFPSSSPTSGSCNGYRKRKNPAAFKATSLSASSPTSCVSDAFLPRSLESLCNINAAAMRYLHKKVSKQLCYLASAADMAYRTQRFGEHRRRLQALVESLLQHRRSVHLRRKIYSSIPALQQSPNGASCGHSNTNNSSSSSNSGVNSSIKKGAVVDVLWKQEWRKGVILGWKFDCGWPQFRQVKVKFSVSSDTLVRWIAADSGCLRSTEESLRSILVQLSSGQGFENQYRLRTVGQQANGAAEEREDTNRSNHKRARPAESSPPDAVKPPGETCPPPSLAIPSFDLCLHDFANLFDHPTMATSIISAYMSTAEPARAIANAAMQPGIKVDAVPLAGSDPRKNPFLRHAHHASTVGLKPFLADAQDGATFKIDVEGVVIKN